MRMLITNWLLSKVKYDKNEAKKCFKNDLILWALNHFGVEPEEWHRNFGKS